jgi:hypothetical protein
VLIFRQGDQWVAQVLEKDMNAHGPTAYAALAAVQLVLQTHVNFDTRHRREPLSRLRQAPAEYWRAYEDAEPLLLDSESPYLPAHMRPAVARESIHPS